MRRCLLIAVALGACAWAAGDVRVFVTSSASGYGLDLLGPQGDGTGTDPVHEDWPIDPFRPTYSTVSPGGDNYYAYDYSYAYYRVAAYPPIDAPSGTINDPILINAAAGEFGCIWFQFRSEPGSARVNEMHTIASAAGESQPTHDLSLTYYVQNDQWGSGVKRWNGWAQPPDYPVWRENPMVFVAVTTWGIVNTLDDPVMMFDHQASGTGVALLGALTAAPSDALYELTIDAVDYSDPQFPPPQVGQSAYFKIVPEPAGLLPIALSTICLRGRMS
jgi:hypothetical protein